MIKKLTTSAAMAATLFGTMAPAVIASAEVKANGDETSTEVPVQYNNTTNIISDADYVITVPAAINFDPKDPSATVQADIAMKDADDMSKDYAGTQTADVEIASDNGMVMEHSNGQKLPYILRYADGGLITSSGPTDLVAAGSYDAANTLNVGTAQLNGTAKSKGLYTDTLTYTVIDTTAAK